MFLASSVVLRSGGSPYCSSVACGCEVKKEWSEISSAAVLVDKMVPVGTTS